MGRFKDFDTERLINKENRMATPQDAAVLIRSRYYQVRFKTALTVMKLELNEASVEENVSLFKKGLKDNDMKEELLLLKQCEKEKLLELYFKPSDIEEGEEYMFERNGKLMSGTIVSCDCCKKWCSVNSGHLLSKPKGIEPAKQLKDIPEMAGYSEERDQSECETCYVNGGKIVKETKVTSSTMSKRLDLAEKKIAAMKEKNTAKFTYNKKTVTVKKIDSSDGSTLRKPWKALGQEIVDQLEDSKSFTKKEIKELCLMKDDDFMKHLK